MDINDNDPTIVTRENLFFSTDKINLNKLCESDYFKISAKQGAG